MNEHLPEDSEPQLELSLRAKGLDDAQLLITVVSLGMCRALAAGTLILQWDFEARVSASVMAELGDGLMAASPAAPV